MSGELRGRDPIMVVQRLWRWRWVLSHRCFLGYLEIGEGLARFGHSHPLPFCELLSIHNPIAS